MKAIIVKQEYAVKNDHYLGLLAVLLKPTAVVAKA
jgi:hypothetical protein